MIGAILTASLLVLTQPCSGLCGNDVIEEVVSPNGKTKALVFQRDCGATTGFSTQISILSYQARLPDKPGNVFIAGNPGKDPPKIHLF